MSDEDEKRKYATWRAQQEQRAKQEQLTPLDSKLALAHELAARSLAERGLAERDREIHEREIRLLREQRAIMQQDRELVLARQAEQQAEQTRFIGDFIPRVMGELERLGKQVGELSTRQPPEAEPAAEQIDQLRSVVAEMQEQINGLRADNALQKQGKLRRGFAYTLYTLAAALPVGVIVRLFYCTQNELAARHAAAAAALAAKVAVPASTLDWPEIWFFYGLPVLATAATSATFFAFAAKLMLSPLVSERIAIAEAERPQTNNKDATKLVASTLDSAGDLIKKIKE